MKQTTSIFYALVLATWVPLADAREISHRYFFHEHMTAAEACERAQQEIKRQALARELGEVIQSQSYQQCLEVASGSSQCETYTDVLAMTALGFVSAFEVTDRHLQVLPTGQACQVTAEVEVERFQGTPDPDFSVSARLYPGPILRHADPIQLHVRAPLGSHLAVFAGRDGAVFERLEMRQVDTTDMFVIPDAHTPFEWLAENTGLAESSERFWIVASQTARSFPQQMTESELFQQLNRSKRSSWDAQWIGFRVLPLEQKGAKK